ncbi:MAG TPA: hypothetical protein VF758_06555 [Candidatus Acidoferrum sp.]
MDVRLNLSTRPLLSHRRFFAGAALVGVFAGLLFLILGWRVYSLRRADEEFRARQQKVQEDTARLEARRQELDRFFAQQENANLQDRAKFTNTVIEARSFNWTQMFMDLEHTLPAGVHVLRIEPKLGKGRAEVKFVVGAVSPESGIKLLKAFEDSKSFSHIELISEKAGGGLPGADPIVVEFTALYARI